MTKENKKLKVKPDLIRTMNFTTPDGAFMDWWHNPNCPTAVEYHLVTKKNKEKHDD